MGNGNKSILEVKNLKKYFPIQKGIFRRTVGLIHAVNGVSLKIDKGETLGLVGESGCGKTTTGKCVLFLKKPSEGEIIFNGVNLRNLDKRSLQKVRPHFQMIFQDPYSSLNPRMSVEAILNEPLIAHKKMSRKERQERILGLLDKVGLRPEYRFRYPHEFSGGQRQRVGIARALALDPELIICDEPVSALDVSIQAQVINLLEKLKDDLKLSYLFISHDIGVVEHISDRIAIMYMGKIVETGKYSEICQNPFHPYTQALMAAIPIPKSGGKGRAKMQLQGDIPSPVHLPDGCYFHSRCPMVMEICERELPKTYLQGNGHEVSCHLFI
jgi:oligopeptide transport system ATP-binding protein